MLAMMRCTLLALLCAFVPALTSQTDSSEPSPRLTIQASLPFAPQGNGTAPVGWYLYPPATVHLDSQVVHNGRWSVRFDRSASSEAAFSVITRSIPVDFAGGEIELHGYIRTRDVTGYAGL